MTSNFYVYYSVITFICLFLTLIYFNSFFSAVLSLIIAFFCCKYSVGYSQTESTLNISIKVPKRESAHVHKIANYFTDSHRADFEKQTISRRLHFTHHYDSDIYLNNTSVANSSFFETPKIMWANHSFSNKQSTSKKKKTSLNSTLPALTTSSPGMTTRLRASDGTTNWSPLSAAGPLLSSPFMPQIKRALGLEPEQRTYSTARRPSVGLGARMPPSPMSPGVVPHVRLDKPRRLSLSQRNTSMLNRSTVKIAPPISGHTGSPSFYQPRAETSMVEDSCTPDTFAVISALKERRKRSINLSDEAPEMPAQQLKRRRQESQQSTASNSSLPGPPMPDNLPDLSAVTFTPRLDSPGLKRPSRPSQTEPGDWEGAAKRPRSESRNNSILSSLSSSKRYLEKQTSKRKADISFCEKENDVDERFRKQRRDTAVLAPDRALRRPTLGLPDVDNRATPSKLVNGHTDKHPTDNQDTLAAKEVSKPPLLKNATSMKKSSSIYSGLSKTAGSKKPQYANVVATADDYDTDRETEQKRVKQILHNLDQSFTDTTGQVSTSTDTRAAGLAETDSPPSALPAASTEASLVPPPTATTVTASITTATLTQSVTTAAVTKTKATNGVKETIAEQETGRGASGTSVSAAVSPPFKPLFDSATTTSVNATSGLPGGFNFSATTTAASATTAETKQGGFSFGLSGATTMTAGQTPLGAPPPYSFTPGQMSTPAAAASTYSAAPVPVAPTSCTASLNFGTSLASAGGLQSGIASTAGPLPSSTQATPVAGFSFPATSASQPTTSATGFSFNPQTTATQSASIVACGATTNSGDFQFSTASVVATTSPAMTAFGMPAITTAAGLSIGPTAPIPASGFNFTAAPTSTSAGTVLSVGGPSVAGGFNLIAAGTPAAGLFSGSATPASSSTPAFGAPPASSTAPVFGMTAGTSGGTVFGGTGGASQLATQPIQFGANTTTTASTGFSFGATTGNPSPAFGATTGNPSPAFGATTINPSPAFGAAPTSAASASAFGAAPLTATPMFGAATTSTSMFGAATTAPIFGATTTATSAMFAFGAGVTTTSANAAPFQPGTQPTFGAGLAFGQNPGTSTAAASPFQFGAAPTTHAAPAFGATSVTQPAPAFGTANSTPKFGAPTATPAFGLANATPTFGAPVPTPTFGTATTQSGSVFGTAPKSNTPVFGASTNAPAFGAATTSTPGFGKSHSMPVFSASTSQNAGFSFGAGGTVQAPNVNPFGGQSTPVKQTAGVFGQQASATPIQQPAAPGVMAFGAGITGTDAALRGFDFSSSAGGAGAGGFNFSANSNGFGTPGGTPGGFNMGAASSTPRPQRVVGKARRRNPKR